MRILCDVDGVLADFPKGYRAAWIAKGLPDYFAEWNTWDLFDFVHKDHHHHVVPMMCEPGFFRALPVMPGAVAALQGIEALGHDVWFCTTPVSESDHCMGEKIAWIREHFGKTAAKKVICTQDKTIIDGHILIDDRPEVVGVKRFPTWEHVIYDQSYNQHVKGKARMTWSTWRTALGL